jgi:hypothetical protein
MWGRPNAPSTVAWMLSRSFSVNLSGCLLYRTQHSDSPESCVLCFSLCSLIIAQLVFKIFVFYIELVPQKIERYRLWLLCQALPGYSNVTFNSTPAHVTLYHNVLASSIALGCATIESWSVIERNLDTSFLCLFARTSSTGSMPSEPVLVWICRSIFICTFHLCACQPRKTMQDADNCVLISALSAMLGGLKFYLFSIPIMYHSSGGSFAVSTVR